MSTDTPVQVQFSSSDGEESEHPKDQKLFLAPTEKYQVFVVVLVSELQNRDSSILSRRDVICACNALFSQMVPTAILQFIGPQDVMIEPILSSGFVKATAIIDVEKSLFDVLIVQSQCRRLADIKKGIIRQFNYTFCSLKEVEQKHKILQTGKCKNEFLEIFSSQETPRQTQILFVVNYRDNQMYTLKKIKLRQLPTWQTMYNNQCNEIREVKALLRLTHPNILRLFSWWIEEEEVTNCNRVKKSYYIYEQLEYVTYNGTSDLFGYALTNLVSQSIDERRNSMKTIMQQIIEGLQYINGQGLFHRDIKPENVLVTKDFWGKMVLKICDFDLSKNTLDQDAQAQKWVIQSKLTGTTGYVSKQSMKDQLYDEQEELHQLGMLMLDLCEICADRNTRLELHKKASEGCFSKQLSETYPIEIDIIKALVVNRQFRNLNELKVSNLYKQYIN